MIQFSIMKTITHVLLFICAMSGGMETVVSQQLPSGQRYLEEKMPDSWGYTTEFEQTLPADDDWWKLFNDPMLDSLIMEGTNNN